MNTLQLQVTLQELYKYSIAISLCGRLRDVATGGCNTPPPPNNSKVGQNGKYLVKVGQSCRSDLATACQRLRTSLVKFG
jgi:hypothetical protein